MVCCKSKKPPKPAKASTTPQLGGSEAVKQPKPRSTCPPRSTTTQRSCCRFKKKPAEAPPDAPVPVPAPAPPPFTPPPKRRRNRDKNRPLSPRRIWTVDWGNQVAGTELSAARHAWRDPADPAPEKAVVWAKYKDRLHKPYSTIPCLDATRVHVKEANNPDGFYHANWIRPPDSDQQYILAQSPDQTNSEDFWAMVFQEKVTGIMLIRREAEKDEWKRNYPEVEGEMKFFGAYTISNAATGKFNYAQRREHLEVAARHLLVTKDGAGEPLEVTHLLVLDWPKDDCPAVELALCELLIYLRDVKSVRTLLLHDEPYAGRSDTVVLLATMIAHMDTRGERTELEAMKRETLERLRACRDGAVRTIEQFIFCCGVMQLYFWERYGEVPNDHLEFIWKLYQRSLLAAPSLYQLQRLLNALMTALNF